MRTLITGGAGFIGSHIVRELLARGAHVKVLDNFSTGKRANLFEVSGDVHIIEGDIRDADACMRACRGVNNVYHLAALGSVPRSIADPLTTDDVNIHGMLSMLVAAKDSGVQRFVFSSSHRFMEMQRKSINTKAYDLARSHPTRLASLQEKSIVECSIVPMVLRQLLCDTSMFLVRDKILSVSMQQ